MKTEYFFDIKSNLIEKRHLLKMKNRICRIQSYQKYF